MNIRRAIFGLGVAMGSLFGIASGAGATVTDVTGGDFSSTLTDVGDWITSFGVAPLFVLAGIVLTIGVALSWFKSKGKRAAT
jgi:hypothetical protein